MMSYLFIEHYKAWVHFHLDYIDPKQCLHKNFAVLDKALWEKHNFYFYSQINHRFFGYSVQDHSQQQKR